MSLRDEIETLVLTFSYHADEQGAYQICANEILKMIEKRISEEISKNSHYPTPTTHEKLIYIQGKIDGQSELKEILK